MINEILNFLTKKQFHDKILIDKKENTCNSEIKIVKEVLNDYFRVSNSPEDDDSLMEMFQEKSQEKFVEIDLIIKGI